MNGQELATAWAGALGLAEGPLFAQSDGEDEARHRVLLNGGGRAASLSLIVRAPTSSARRQKAGPGPPT